MNLEQRDSGGAKWGENVKRYCCSYCCRLAQSYKLPLLCIKPVIQLFEGPLIPRDHQAQQARQDLHQQQFRASQHQRVRRGCRRHAVQITLTISRFTGACHTIMSVTRCRAQQAYLRQTKCHACAVIMLHGHDRTGFQTVMWHASD